MRELRVYFSRAIADGTIIATTARAQAPGATAKADTTTPGATESSAAEQLAAMRLVIPHAVGQGTFTGKRLRFEVKQLGESMNAEFVDCTGDDYAYFRLLRRLWAAGQDVIVNEQDVEASPEVLRSMAACNEEWCAGFYWHYDGVVYLGEDRPTHPVRRPGTYLCCNKFSGALMKRTQNILSGPGRGLHWAGLDLTLIEMLKGSGAQPHLHEPAVRHLALGANPPAWVPLIADDAWVDG